MKATEVGAMGQDEIQVDIIGAGRIAPPGPRTFPAALAAGGEVVALASRFPSPGSTVSSYSGSDTPCNLAADRRRDAGGGGVVRLIVCQDTGGSRANQDISRRH